MQFVCYMANDDSHKEFLRILGDSRQERMRIEREKWSRIRHEKIYLEMNKTKEGKFYDCSICDLDGRVIKNTGPVSSEIVAFSRARYYVLEIQRTGVPDFQSLYMQGAA